MEFDSSNLTNETRQLILTNIRNSIGDSKYQTIINEIGEDEVIKVFIQQAAKKEIKVPVV